MGSCHRLIKKWLRFIRVLSVNGVGVGKGVEGLFFCIRLSKNTVWSLMHFFLNVKGKGWI